jgi:hypothetical protein
MTMTKTIHANQSTKLAQTPERIVLDERVQTVSFTDDKFHVSFMDGRVLSVPIHWYPHLLHATPEQRTGWTISDDGWTIRWSQLDETISTEELLYKGPSNDEAQPRLEQNVRLPATDEAVAVNAEALVWAEALIGDVALDDKNEEEIVKKAIAWAEELLQKYKR